MKKGQKIEAFVESLSTESTHDPCYEGYFICFNEQKYYEAHDVLEHLWLKEQGPAHQFFKGLIQLAGAFVHLQKQYRRPDHPTDGRRLRPAWRLFKLAQTNLEPFFPAFLDLDVRSVVGALLQKHACHRESGLQEQSLEPGCCADAGLASRGNIQR